MARFIKSGLGYKRIFSKSELSNIHLKNAAESIVAERDYLKARLDSIEGLLEGLLTDNSEEESDVNVINTDDIEESSEETTSEEDTPEEDTQEGDEN